MNTLVVIGWIGIKSCYLNVSREDAIRRYLDKNPDERDLVESGGVLIEEFEFADEFGAYDIYEPESPYGVETDASARHG